MRGDGLPPVGDWWAVGPSGQVTFFSGVPAELLGIALDPLPVGAPAVVEFHAAESMLMRDLVSVLLIELDRVAIELFPVWLPGAERIKGCHGMGPAAVRALAEGVAAHSETFGPFLADLAERGLCGRRAGAAAIPAAVRASGLSRVIADAYGRSATALLVTMAEHLPPGDERALVAACEWLAQYGRMAVWLAGAPLRIVDHVRVVTVVLPDSLSQLVVESIEDGGARGSEGSLLGPVLRVASLAGVPRTDSPAEQKLERALSPHDWAQGREWNRTFEWHVLSKPYRLDLFWPSAGVIVEVDGPEHRGRLQYADDRRRDVQLQLLGHNVLRFTNEQVLTDVGAVTIRIEQILRTRRKAK